MTAHNYQEKINIGVYQGEHQYSKDNIKLGEIDIKVEPYPKGHEKFEVTFAYDLNGLLIVETKNLRTNDTYELILEKEDDLSIEESKKRLQKLRELKLEVKSEVDSDLAKRVEELFELLDNENQMELNHMFMLYQKSREQNSLIKLNKVEQNFLEYLSNLEKKLDVESVNKFDENWFQSKNNR
ncbi:Hsp70 family protein [Anaerosporobacter sp.]